MIHACPAGRVRPIGEFVSVMARVKNRLLDPSGPNSVLGVLLRAGSDFHAELHPKAAAVLTSYCLRADQIIDVPLVSIARRRTFAYETSCLSG
jgi:hypothetical protein